MKRIALVVLFALAAASLGALAYAQISVSGSTTGNLVWIESLLVGFGGDARIRAFRTGNVSYNAGSIAATSKLCTSVATIAGIENGDTVFLNQRAAFEDDIVTSETRIDSAGDDFELCLYNPTAGAIDPVAVTVDWFFVDLTP